MGGTLLPTMLNHLKILNVSTINTNKFEKNHQTTCDSFKNNQSTGFATTNIRVVVDWKLKSKSNGIISDVADVLGFICTETNLNNIQSKHDLPVAYFSASGFDGGKKDQYVAKHSGLIIIDIDTEKNTDLDFVLLKHQLSTDPFAFACFTSPRGGLKVLINTDIKETSHHKFYYESIRNYFLATYPHIKEIDASGSNIARACYLPYDSQLFVNLKSAKFELGDEEIAKFYVKNTQQNQVISHNLSIDDLEYITLDEHIDNIMTLLMRKGVVMNINDEFDENRKDVVITDFDCSSENRKEVDMYANIFNSFRYNLLNRTEQKVMSIYFRFFELLILKHSYPYRLDFRTRIDETYFSDKSKEIVSSFEIDGFDGMEICEVVLPKNGKIREGSRGKTLANITMKLIYNNPFCHPHYLFKTVKWINDSYCEDPNPQNPKPDDEEVFNIVMYNYQKFLNGETDFSPAVKKNGKNEVVKKHVFWSKNSTTHGIKQKQLEGVRVYHKGRKSMMEHKYHQALIDLQDGIKITQKRIGEYMGVDERTVRNYQTPVTKELIKKYNETLRKTGYGKAISKPVDYDTLSTPKPDKITNSSYHPVSDIDFSEIELDNCEKKQSTEEINDVELDEVFENIFEGFIKRNAGIDVEELRKLFYDHFYALAENEKKLLAIPCEKIKDSTTLSKQTFEENMIRKKVLEIYLGVIH